MLRAGTVSSANVGGVRFIRVLMARMQLWKSASTTEQQAGRHAGKSRPKVSTLAVLALMQLFTDNCTVRVA
jgi:hypothetical protein